MGNIGGICDAGIKKNIAMTFIISASIELLSAFSVYLQFKKKSEDIKEKLGKLWTNDFQPGLCIRIPKWFF
ncbi:MAG: hypothetical protein KA713_06875 [Chryseotalea sp. WA131a]|nr:MAG: hypothetical protein KA713_06875 [Chryseotalea sp. WA131a]